MKPFTPPKQREKRVRVSRPVEELPASERRGPPVDRPTPPKRGPKP